MGIKGAVGAETISPHNEGYVAPCVSVPPGRWYGSLQNKYKILGESQTGNRDGSGATFPNKDTDYLSFREELHAIEAVRIRQSDRAAVARLYGSRLKVRIDVASTV